MGLRTLGRSGLLLVAAIPFATGCQTNSKWTREARWTVIEAFEATPEPAASLGAMWNKELAYLNDPTKDGVMNAGMVGLVNLYSSNGLPTKADGDLFIMARDESTHAPGQPPSNAEIWQFDTKTLRRQLKTTTDRGLVCYALFLPWPKDWVEVSRVRMQVKYVPKEGPPLHTGDELVMFTMPPNTAGATGTSKGVISTVAGIPSLKAIQKGLSDGNRTTGFANAPVAPGPISPTSAFVPAAPGPVAPPTLAPVVAPAPLPPMNAPMPQPVPPPPPAMSAVPPPEPVPVRPVAAPQPVPTVAAQPIPITPTPKPVPTTSVVVGEGLPAIDLPATR